MKFYRSKRFDKCEHDPRKRKWCTIVLRKYLIPTHNKHIKTERVWIYTPFGNWFVEWDIIRYG